ncbi:putative glycoside hydrolase [Candidatus Uhrbacteria bacterium]|nr:putative glycoside hydrolase [Candidatus Uhrbacteria bacterium]
MPNRRRVLLIAFPVTLFLTAAGLGGFEIYRQFQAPRLNSIFLASTSTSSDAVVPIAPTNTLIVVEPPEPVTLHVPLPDEVRGIYWTAETARIHRAEELRAYMLKTGLNTAVIDLKMDNGQVVMPPQTIVDELGKDNIYRIARIAVMRDSVYARAHPDQAIKSTSGKLWLDKTGAAWLNPSHVEIADTALDLAREAYKMGFDEIQFDYIRFASDGSLSSISKADNPKIKTDIMRAFFENVGGALMDEHIPVSFDLFGMTFLTAEDFGIGQRLEDAYPNADFVSPMAYPSHYWPGYLGFKNPADHPYEVVKATLDKGAEILETDHFISATSSRPHFRPWIQDFDIGATYTAKHIEAQIKASRDAGASGWILWNARNVYEPANYAPLTQKKTID